MSFSNRIARVKDCVVEMLQQRLAVCLLTSVPPHARRSKLGLYGQIRNVAKDRLVAVNRGPWRRSGQSLRRGQSLRHFGDANVSGKARYVQPVHDREIRERQENDGRDYEPRRSEPNENKRQRE